MYIYKCVYVYICMHEIYIYMHTHAHGKIIKKRSHAFKGEQG